MGDEACGIILVRIVCVCKCATLSNRTPPRGGAAILSVSNGVHVDRAGRADESNDKSGESILNRPFTPRVIVDGNGDGVNVLCEPLTWRVPGCRAS